MGLSLPLSFIPHYITYITCGTITNWGWDVWRYLAKDMPQMGCYCRRIIFIIVSFYFIIFLRLISIWRAPPPTTKRTQGSTSKFNNYPPTSSSSTKTDSLLPPTPTSYPLFCTSSSRLESLSLSHSSRSPPQPTSSPTAAWGASSCY